MKRGFVLVLRDSGNVQFLGDGGVLWESFGFPTDTLLPGQSWKGFLFSKRADTEFTTGRFSLAAQNDGNVVLCVDLFTGDILENAYWDTRTNGTNGNTTITFDERGNLSYTLYDGTVYSLISPVAAGRNYFQFVRMDPDGIVRAYVHPKNGDGRENTTSWTVSGTLPSEGGCKMKTTRMQGMCGPGSYCVETKERLKCLCPSGYTYIDAQHSDSGCTPELEPQSSGEQNSPDKFSLVELPNKHNLGGVNILQEVPGNNLTTKALIKVRTRNSQLITSARMRNVLAYRVVAICLGILFLITVGGLLAHHYLIRNRDSQRLLSSSVRAFSWKELYQATNGFEKLLGKGSFGEVYKGTIRSLQPHLIAAFQQTFCGHPAGQSAAAMEKRMKKLIDSNKYSEQEFTNEVQSIGQIYHRNLVRMIGYCKEGKHRMLVFEFMPGGSLRSVLFNPERRPSWRWRAEAALAIARGLEYLHDGCSAPIIHCDIKPDNILLDDRGVPRITDFGISKLLGSQQVHTTVTHIRGTRGCQEPVSHSDLPQGEEDDETVTLFGWAAQLVATQRTELMLHGDADVDTAEDMERVERFTRVALWCVEPNPLLRPTTHQVVQNLETNDPAQLQALPHQPPDCYMESSPLIPQLKMAC
ncbi:unnamed protein product [Triticum turgidum subsp. durum]|uniref:non-specific serine/threonine protein kinase n=1 Tax=Triticum turgidum subsp. durum TaxID=4567 RepID=A0A9R0VEX6_TRITD|nr:unnamed protein product [Triticum turgidum subsp. durum]